MAMTKQIDPILEAVSYPYPIDQKRRKLRVAIVTGTHRVCGFVFIVGREISNIQKTFCPRLMVLRVHLDVC